MLVTHEREKLINAIIFFAERTKHLGKTKLFKLLYFLDFEHFKLTGRSVTGLEYFAWKMGPVPVELFEEVEGPEPDLAEKVQFVETPTRNGSMFFVKALARFDESLFSPRELGIMDSLAGEYRDAQAGEMVEATHLENQPWHLVYVERGERQKLIPYGLAVRRQEEGELREIAAEREAFVEHFKAK